MLGNCERSRVEIGIHTLCQKHLVVAETGRSFGPEWASVGSCGRVTDNPDITRSMIQNRDLARPSTS
jgi:hypothetical protein